MYNSVSVCIMKNIFKHFLLIGSVSVVSFSCQKYGYYCETGFHQYRSVSYVEKLTTDGYLFTDYVQSQTGGTLKNRISAKEKTTLCVPQLNEVEATLRPGEAAIDESNEYFLTVGIAKTNSKSYSEFATTNIKISLKNFLKEELFAYDLSVEELDESYLLPLRKKEVKMSDFNYKYNFDLNALLPIDYNEQIEIDIDYICNVEEESYVRRCSLFWQVEKTHEGEQNNINMTFCQPRISSFWMNAIYFND